MQKRTVKTTVEIDSELLYKAKRKALEERTTLRKLINRSLAEAIGVPKKSRLRKKVIIGGHKLGGVKGSLNRTEIYEHV